MQHRRRLCACVLACAIIAAGLQTAAAAPDAGPSTPEQQNSVQDSSANSSSTNGSSTNSLHPDNIDRAVSAFMGLVSDPYNLGDGVLPSSFSLNKAGLRDELLSAAENVRTSMRQGLDQVVAQAANATAAWVAAAQKELEQAGGAAGGVGGAEASRLLQRLSAIPIKFDAHGNTLMSNPLAAIGAFMVNGLQAQLKGLMRGTTGPAVQQPAGDGTGTTATEGQAPGAAGVKEQLAQSAAGRRLLAEMEAFIEAEPLPVDDGDDSSLQGTNDDAIIVDLAAASPRAGPAAVARQMDRLMSFLVSLADVADDVIAEVEKITGPGDETDEAAPAYTEDEEGAATEEGEGAATHAASQRRRLQQAALLPDPNAGYAKAVRLIFSNIFDFFRANGLYGLTPLLADLRGVLTRYNWIADVLNILDAPLENFINANYIPLPQSNDDFVKLVQRFASDYCKLEKADSSETVLGAFDGPTTSYEVKPVSCPIYTDPATGRNYVSFADCDPATLVIKTTPLTITEAYFSAADYTGTECKYSEPYGTDVSIKIGGGEQMFTFTRSAKGIDIIPTVIQLNGRGRFHNSVPPAYDADTNLPGSNPPVGNGFFANNFGWAFNGVNPPRVG